MITLAVRIQYDAETEWRLWKLYACYVWLNGMRKKGENKIMLP